MDTLQKLQTAGSWPTEGVWVKWLPITFSPTNVWENQICVWGTHISTWQQSAERQMFQALTSTFYAKFSLDIFKSSQTVIFISYSFVTFYVYLSLLIEYNP